MATALLIPIYEPTEKVVPFLKQFQAGEFDTFLVVDDGSGPDYQAIFQEISASTVFDVISYPQNQGKGHALKTGIFQLKEAFEDLDFIVTADGDGQHAKEDILRVKEEAINRPNTLVLGTRVFENAPPKSQSGNVWVCRYFSLATGHRLPDTQTGLRAIPANLFDLSLQTYGNRFEYEMNFLKDAVMVAPVYALPIQTIYEDGNKGTHFRAVVDSLRIMKAPILSFIAGVIATGLVMALLVFFMDFLHPTGATVLNFGINLLLATIIVGPFLFLFRNFFIYHRHKMALRSVMVFLLANLLTVLAATLIYIPIHTFMLPSFYPLAAFLGIFLIGIFRFFYSFKLCYHE